MIIFKLKRFIKNIYFFIISGKAKRHIENLEMVQRSLIKEMLILKYKEKASTDNDLLLALNYIQETGDYCMIPYHKKGHGINVESGYDKFHKLPYVMHCGKRLYFPHSWDKDLVTYSYINYIENESLTGNGIKERSPHQYQSDTFFIEEGDVVVDIGCAEALVSLDVIDKVSKVYLVENDKQWYKPLDLTFAKWSDKTIILHKTLSNHDSNDAVSLDSIIKKEYDKTIFIKMDIEGGELLAIKDAEQILKTTKQKIKIACCVYHRIDDAENIKLILKRCGFSVSFSSGYILTDFLDESKLLSFRKGVIYATKNL